LQETAATDLADALGERRWLVLTGAGVSTDSGIPDYRGAGAPVRTPMTIARFRSGHEAQQRYWARSFLGWSSMGAARPNAIHRQLAALEDAGRLSGLITQNVDGLHTAAGHRDVIELHGRIDRVVCLGCGTTSDRAALQDRLTALNRAFAATDVRMLPDGDVDLEATTGFVVAACEQCGGVLKPDVVFFGESVPPERVVRCTQLVEDAEALVVLGSSLQVFSGRRFVKQAHARGIPVVIVNRGETRGDALATLKVDAGCAETLADTLPESVRLFAGAGWPRSVRCLSWSRHRHRSLGGALRGGGAGRDPAHRCAGGDPHRGDPVQAHDAVLVVVLLQHDADAVVDQDRTQDPAALDEQLHRVSGVVCTVQSCADRVLHRARGAHDAPSLVCVRRHGSCHILTGLCVKASTAAYSSMSG
jgi:NAD-dependent SIR2 family protein deacetylase